AVVEAGMTLPLFLKVVDLSFWEVRVGTPVKSWAGKLEEVLEVVEGPARLVVEVEDTEGAVPGTTMIPERMEMMEHRS
ncbi:hypothetical protein M9458_035530, partial [Cirrhinus mrigala]